MPAGQRINVTLYEFGGSAAQRPSHLSTATGKSLASITSHLSSPGAETYGQLREHNPRRRRRPVDIVGRDLSSRRPGGDPDRRSHVLTTETSALEVFTYDLPGRIDFLLTFTGIGNLQHDLSCVSNWAHSMAAIAVPSVTRCRCCRCCCGHRCAGGVRQ